MHMHAQDRDAVSQCRKSDRQKMCITSSSKQWPYWNVKPSQLDQQTSYPSTDLSAHLNGLQLRVVELPLQVLHKCLLSYLWRPQPAQRPCLHMRAHSPRWAGIAVLPPITHARLAWCHHFSASRLLEQAVLAQHHVGIKACLQWAVYWGLAEYHVAEFFAGRSERPARTCECALWTRRGQPAWRCPLAAQPPSSPAACVQADRQVSTNYAG